MPGIAIKLTPGQTSSPSGTTLGFLWHEGLLAHVRRAVSPDPDGGDRRGPANRIRARGVRRGSGRSLYPSWTRSIIGIALPTTLNGIFAAGARTALVPSYVAARKTSGSDRARRVAGSILAVSIVGGFAITALLYVAAEPIVALTGPGLDAVGRESAISYLRLLAPAALLAAISTVLWGVLQAEQRFRAIGASMVAGPLVAIIFMVLTWDRLGLESLAVSTLMGSVIMPASMLVATRHYGITPILTISPRGMGLRAFASHALPLSVGAAILQLNQILDRAIATVVQNGGVAALGFADRLIRSPITAISPAWSGAVYPAMVETVQDRTASRLGGVTVRTARYAIVAFTPISFLSAAAAPFAVSTVYSRGAFTSDDVQTVAGVVAAFAPIIAIHMTSSPVTNALNARRSSMVLLASSIVSVILNLALDVVLGLAFGVVGIALASSVTQGATLVFKATRLARLAGWLHTARGGRDRRAGMRLFSTSLSRDCGGVLVRLVAWRIPAGYGGLGGLRSRGSGGLRGRGDPNRSARAARARGVRLAVRPATGCVTRRCIRLATGRSTA